MCTVCVPVKLCIREGGVSCHSGRFTGGASPALPATAVSAPRTAPGKAVLAPGLWLFSSPACPPPPQPEYRRGIVGFSLVLDLLQLPCSVAWDVEAPGAQESGPDWDSNSLPLGDGGSLDWWLEFLERGQG